MSDTEQNSVVAFTPSPLNQWDLALTEGKLAELAFAVLLGKHMGIKVTSNNTEDVKAVDCRGEFQADVKILKAPYPAQKTPSGLDKSEHVTLDVANINKYADDVAIQMIVDYTEAGVPTAGWYWITAGRVREIMSLHPERVYSRSSRSMKDKVVKVGISINEANQVRLGDMTGKETAAAFIELMEVLRDRNNRMKEKVA